MMPVIHSNSSIGR